MSVRLNKVIRELNIGLQTAVEFLEKRSNLGEVKAEPSFKLNDAQYDALIEAFKKDKEVKVDANKLFTKKVKDKEKKKTEQRVETKVETAPQQKFTPLGKIDLESIGKPAPKKEEAKPIEEKKAVETEAKKPVEKPEVKAEKPVSETKAEEQTKPVVEEKKDEKPQPKEESQPKPVKEEQPKPVEEKSQEAELPIEQSQPEKDDKEENSVFTLKSEKKLAPKVKVLGSINLDELNQSTRPKKKSKEEKRREREEKAAQQKPQNGEKKKRQRITKERVDI